MRFTKSVKIQVGRQMTNQAHAKHCAVPKTHTSAEPDQTH